MWHWGKDSEEPLAALKLFKAQRATAIEKAAHFPTPIEIPDNAPPEDPVDEAVIAHFNDEDFIDLHPPKLQRSKPVNVSKK